MYFTKAFLGESNIVPLHSTGTYTYNSQKPPPTSISRNRAERSRLCTILGLVWKRIETLIYEHAYSATAQYKYVLYYKFFMSFWGRSHLKDLKAENLERFFFNITTQVYFLLNQTTFNLYFCARVLKSWIIIWNPFVYAIKSGTLNSRNVSE